MTQDQVLQVFRDSGALLEGHFILRSGLRSRQFFQCALALQQMPAVEKLGAALAAKLKPLGAVRAPLRFRKVCVPGPANANDEPRVSGAEMFWKFALF